MARIKVIYIASSPRSGSTIFERALGQIPGFFAAGELRYLWERGLIEKQLCGCGKTVPECDFWCQCLAECRGELSNQYSPQQINELLNQIMRLRNTYLRLLPTALRPKSYPAQQIREFSELLAALFRGIAKTSGANVILDSSKLVSYASLLLDAPGIEVHVVHLVRDSRAVVFSHQRVKERPEVVGETIYMDRIPWWKVSLFWVLNNLSVHFLRGGNVKSITRVRYETFVQNPRSEIARILERIGEQRMDWEKILTAEDTIDLHVNHTVAGNPIRFHVGDIVLRKDNEWEILLDRQTRRWVTLLTLPLLWRYGFSL